MYTFRLFFKLIKFRFLSLIEYRGAFLGGLTAQWITYAIDILMLFIVVGQFGTIAGWLPQEVIFHYAVWLLSYAIGASFTFNLANSFSQMSINGTMDEALARPMPTLMYLMASDFNLAYISHISLTIVALVFSINQLNVVWAAVQWIWLIVLILSGAVIQGCLMLIFDMPALRTRSVSPTGVFFWEIGRFMQYPINIYPKALQIIFTTVLPYGFINYYPLQVLLKNENDNPLFFLKWISPFVALILILITALCWHLTIRRYESSGT